jgi:HEAT repeat protein
LVVGKWLTLSAAMGLALTATVLPLTASTSELVNYGVAGAAILFGLAAVALSIAARRSMLEAAVTTLFLALAGLLISVNTVLSAGRSKDAADAAAKATAKEDEARQERERAEAARNSAAEMLKKAEEAPARAEAALKKAQEAEARAEEAPEKAARLLKQVKVEQAKLDKKRDQLAAEKADLAAERGKVQEAKDKLDDQRKEVEASKQAAAELAKKAEEDKRRSKELLDKAEQKEKDAQALHKRIETLQKKIEDAVKVAAANLKDKNPAIRIKTANALAKLPSTPEMKVAAEPLVEAMMDPMPEVRSAASEALAKIAPAIQPHVLTLLIGNDKQAAARQLQGLGKEAKSALPALIHCYRSIATGGLGVRLIEMPVVTAGWLDTLAGIAPDDKRVVQIVLDAVMTKTNNNLPRVKAIALLDVVQADKSAKIKALVTAVDDSELAVQAIIAIERIGAPEAAEALPALKKLKLSPNDAVRQAATSAVTKIESSK